LTDVEFLHYFHVFQSSGHPVRITVCQYEGSDDNGWGRVRSNWLSQSSTSTCRSAANQHAAAIHHVFTYIPQTHIHIALCNCSLNGKLQQNNIEQEAQLLPRAADHTTCSIGLQM